MNLNSKQVEFNIKKKIFICLLIVVTVFVVFLYTHLQRFPITKRLSLIGERMVETLEVFNSQITAYPATCSESHCVPLNKSTYTVDEKNQSVLEEWPGLKFPVERYTDCAVKNLENWSCYTKNKEWRIGFSEGEFFQYFLLRPQSVQKIYIDRGEWWKLQGW